MSDTQLGETIHHLRTDESIAATISDVSPVADFSHGFVDSTFMYEKPVLYLQVETEYGDIQIEIPFRNMETPMLRDFFTMPIDSIDEFDITNFIGEKVYLHIIDDDWLTLSWTRNPQMYDESVLYRDDNFRKTDFDGDEVDQFSLESRSNEYISQLIQRDLLRQEMGTNGWLEVPLIYDMYEGENVFIAQFHNKNVYFPFDNTISTVSNIEDFLSHLGIEYTPSEFDNETVWIKPIRDLHHTNRPDTDDLLCAEEMWTVAPEPYDESDESTWWERVKEFLSVSNNDGITVEMTNDPTRKAKSSVLHDIKFEDMEIRPQEAREFEHGV